MRNVFEVVVGVFATLTSPAMEVKFVRIEFVKLAAVMTTCAHLKNHVSTKSVKILAKSLVNVVYVLNVQLLTMVFNVVVLTVLSVTEHLLVLRRQKYAMNIANAMNMDCIAQKLALGPLNVPVGKFVTPVNVEASAVKVSHALWDRNVNEEVPV